MGLFLAGLVVGIVVTILAPVGFEKLKGLIKGA